MTGERGHLLQEGKKREIFFLAVLPGEPIPICGFDALFHK